MLELSSPNRENQALPLGRWGVLSLLVLVLLAIFAGRTYLARAGNPPGLFDLFNLITAGGSVLVLFAGCRRLGRTDWLVGLGLGAFVGLQLPFATLFHPYPFLGIVHADVWQALIRGTYTILSALGGLAIMRSSGPIHVYLAESWRRAPGAFLFGAVVGIPLAVLNAFANAWAQGHSFVWQSLLAAAADAFQPAVVEEVVYRLAFLGLLWLVLRRVWPARQATILASVIALLVHNYAHFGDEFLSQPLATLGMGAVMSLLWGLPLTVLALRRGLDSAIGFHWVQDFARFWVGL